MQTISIAKRKSFPIKWIILLFLMLILGITTTYILGNYYNDKYNRRNKIEGNKNGNGRSSKNNLDIKVKTDKDMHRLGNHFNKHGRGMGFASKKEYQRAAVDFAQKYRSHSQARIMQGTWNGKGGYTGMKQIAISFENKTVILCQETGQLIDFYVGTELRGLINLMQLLP